MGTNNDATAETINSVPICRTCNSEQVAIQALACFNRQSGLWELETTSDDAHCHQCSTPTTLDWIAADTLQNKRVRDLNDRFRKDGHGNGSIFITQGVQAAGEAFLASAVESTRTFRDFSDDNDPWGEHDFGAFDIDGKKVFFKIDCYDRTLKHGSENPANEGLTHRVLTIMLASEY